MDRTNIWAIYIALEQKLIRSDVKDEKELATIEKQLTAIATLLPKGTQNRNNMC